VHLTQSIPFFRDSRTEEKDEAQKPKVDQSVVLTTPTTDVSPLSSLNTNPAVFL
jgi:hypothetical protein